MTVLMVDDEITALNDLEKVLKRVLSDVKILRAEDGDNALEICRKESVDVVFLDINMPGENGISLAERIKTIRPMVNIIMVTAYPEYALDAMKLYVSDYILKPAMEEDVRNALNHLRNPIEQKQEGLFVRCFGNFEVFFDGQPVHFGRAKSKELFAYLIDRKGSSASSAELRAALWGDEVTDEEKQRKYLSQLAYELRKKLDEMGMGDIFIQSYDAYALNVDKIPCDYYMVPTPTGSYNLAQGLGPGLGLTPTKSPCINAPVRGS